MKFGKQLAVWALLLHHSTGLSANVDWWFDVEVILFKQDASQVQETFNTVIEPIDVSGSVDLLSPYLKPELSGLIQTLPLCQVEPEVTFFTQTVFEPVSDYFDPAQWEMSTISNETEFSAQSIVALSNTASDSPPNSANYIAEANPSNLAQALDNTQSPFNEPSVQAEEEPVTAQTDVETTSELPSKYPPWWLQAVRWDDLLKLDCRYDDRPMFYLDEIDFPSPAPVIINGITRRLPQGFSLLSADDLALKDIFTRVKRQRRFEPILHIGWRQPVKFGRSKAEPVRLFAGTNYSDTFDYWGNTRRPDIDSEPFPPLLPGVIEADPAIYEQRISEQLSEHLTQELDIVSKVEHALANESLPALLEKQEQIVQQRFAGELPEQVWELDGLFKVYLQYLNRVPYLHIDSQFNYRQPGMLEQQSSDLMQDQQQAKQFLYAYPFQQLRRIISTQVHYFDHPYFGMIVQVRRYHVPQATE